MRFSQVNSYEFTLTLKNFIGIWDHIKKIKCQRMFELLIIKSRKQNFDLKIITEQKKLIKEENFSDAFKNVYSYYTENSLQGKK